MAVTIPFAFGLVSDVFSDLAALVKALRIACALRLTDRSTICRNEAEKGTLGA
jgi:hypothetical protein